MLHHLQGIARIFGAVLLLSGIGLVQAGPASLDQLAIPATAPPPQITPQSVLAAAQAPNHQLNAAYLPRCANEDVGADLEVLTSSWQRELERLENTLRRPGVRYSELNSIRDELQRVRGSVDEFEARLGPCLAAAKAQVDLLGSLPAA